MNNKGPEKYMTQEISLKVTAEEFGNSPIVFIKLRLCY